VGEADSNVLLMTFISASKCDLSFRQRRRSSRASTRQLQSG